jgi:hypothetical protein
MAWGKLSASQRPRQAYSIEARGDFSAIIKPYEYEQKTFRVWLPPHRFSR